VLPTGNHSGTFWSCIWDAGGNDTISNAGTALASTINLNDAPLSGRNGGGFVSAAKDIVGGYTIANGAEIENAIGGNAKDKLIGNGLANTLKGNDGSDILTGGNGADRLLGGSGGDRLIGGAGPDRLAGGLDADKFIFDAPLSPTQSDTVVDFAGGVDVLRLDDSVFTELGGRGALASAAFHVGASAADSSDRVIYNENTGGLFYDRDGSGAAAQVRFATLDTNLALSSSDFEIF
jgi:serralysin